MSNAELPVIVDPFKLTDQDVTVSGKLELAPLERVCSLLWQGDAGDDSITVELHFHRDDEHRRLVTGTLQGDVSLTCQRCLDVMRYSVSSEFELAIVQNDEQAARLPKRLDPLQVEGFALNLHEMMEDEVLLSLPAFPLHAPSECGVAVAVNDDAEPVEARRENPFGMLAELKKNPSGTKH